MELFIQTACGRRERTTGTHTHTHTHSEGGKGHLPKSLESPCTAPQHMWPCTMQPVCKESAAINGQTETECALGPWQSCYLKATFTRLPCVHMCNTCSVFNGSLANGPASSDTECVALNHSSSKVASCTVQTSQCSDPERVSLNHSNAVVVEVRLTSQSQSSQGTQWNNLDSGQSTASECIPQCRSPNALEACGQSCQRTVHVVAKFCTSCELERQRGSICSTNAEGVVSVREATIDVLQLTMNSTDQNDVACWINHHACGPVVVVCINRCGNDVRACVRGYEREREREREHAGGRASILYTRNESRKERKEDVTTHGRIRPVLFILNTVVARLRSLLHHAGRPMPLDGVTGLPWTHSTQMQRGDGRCTHVAPATVSTAHRA